MIPWLVLRAKRAEGIQKEFAVIIVILFMAFLLRIWGIDYDLPYIYHPDEPGYIIISQNIFKTGDLNPHFFNYPSLFFYINAFAYIPYYLVGKLIGIFRTPGDIVPPLSLAMGVTRAPMPSAVLLGRFITVCFGIGTVGLGYIVGKRITGRVTVGALTSLIIAISPTNVWHSRLITPDTFVTFFALTSLLGATLIYQCGKRWHYIIAGICTGLTASTKYNGGLVIVTLLVAHFLRHRRESLKQVNLYLALFLCGISFLATTPYAVFDSTKFLNDLKFEIQHYSTGHAGMEGDSLRWYLNYMWNTAGGIYLLAVLGIFYGYAIRPHETALVSVFPLTYFLFISRFVVRNDRTFLPVTPFLFLLSAWFLILMFDKIKNFRIRLLRQILLGFIAIFALISMAHPLLRTIEDTRHMMTVDSRETARIWIDLHLPAGSKIAIESYAPFVDPNRFSVQGFGRMIDHEPEWYVEQGFDYLVFSEGMYGRFYRDPNRYRNEILSYNNLFSRFTLVAMFTDGGYEVRVYKVR